MAAIARTKRTYANTNIGDDAVAVKKQAAFELPDLQLAQARGVSSAPIPFPGTASLTTAFVRDSSGSAPRAPDPGPQFLIDTVPGDRTSTVPLTVDGAHVISTIDTVGDQDFYVVQLVAGQTYAFSMSMVTGGPTLLPLADSYLELYSSAGALLLSADGGGNDPVGGLDAVLTFTALDTGTYYINARAFDQDATNGTGGDFIGDYELSVATVTNDPTAYRPFYSSDSPLHSIDWGTQFDRTSRNPDGDNGTRSDNGVENGGTPISNNPYGIVGKNVITYYYAETGDIFISDDPTTVGTTDTIVAQGMQQWEMDAFERAWDIYESVADIVYVRVYDRAQADIKIITYEGTPGVGASLLGRMSPPGENNAGQMEINTGDVRWTEEGVAQGGFYFPTLLHEFGHGHGMAHPHDNGGHSSVMRGAEPSEDPVEGAIGGQLGDFGLSQQVFTIMSYNDGWQSSPYGGPRSGGITGTEVDHFGWMGTLAALDIAVIQDKYGVNEEHATGDDLYVIKGVNAIGTFYSCIWDGGGNDEIRYVGSADAVIDLRPATLQYEEGGGGRVSYAWGIFGGFTIANGVTIERATSGEGDDLLTGNDAANILASSAGADILQGRGGDDVLNAGADNDIIIGGAGNDQIDGGDGYDIAGYSGVRRAYTADAHAVVGADGSDTLTGVEDLAFTDGRLTFARDSQAAQVMRLYDAALDRAPDQSGFEALLDAVEGGMSLTALANEFVNSAEFQSRFGSLTDRQYVEQLYVFALNRTGDAPGIETWVNALAGGMTRAQLLVEFSESSEHKDLMQERLDDGLWVADDLTLQIARLYDATYDRLPDQQGLQTWRDALGGGMNLMDIAQAFATAPEFLSTYGSLNNHEFVELMYQLCLNRNGDAEGIATWTAALEGGMARGEVLFHFSESDEHIVLTRDTFLGGVPCIDMAASPATAETEAKSFDDGVQVFPMSPDAGLEDGGKDTGPIILPGVIDDGFLIAKIDVETQPQVLLGPDSVDRFDLADVLIDISHDHTGLDARLGMLFLETGEQAPDNDSGIDAAFHLRHEPDPWAA